MLVNQLGRAPQHNQIPTIPSTHPTIPRLSSLVQTVIPSTTAVGVRRPNSQPSLVEVKEPVSSSSKTGTADFPIIYHPIHSIAGVAPLPSKFHTQVSINYEDPIHKTVLKIRASLNERLNELRPQKEELMLGNFYLYCWGDRMDFENAMLPTSSWFECDFNRKDTYLGCLAIIELPNPNDPHLAPIEERLPELEADLKKGKLATTLQIVNAASLKCFSRPNRLSADEMLGLNIATKTLERYHTQYQLLLDRYTKISDTAFEARKLIKSEVVSSGLTVDDALHKQVKNNFNIKRNNTRAIECVAQVIENTLFYWQSIPVERRYSPAALQ